MLVLISFKSLSKQQIVSTRTSYNLHKRYWNGSIIDFNHQLVNHSKEPLFSSKTLSSLSLLPDQLGRKQIL
jgi:hypothetical protein